MKNYKIAVAGTGYVGLSLGVLFAQHHQVVAVDIVQAKVDMINNKKSPIQDDYIEKYLAEKDLDALLGLLHKKPPRRSSYEAQLSESNSLVTTTQIAKEYGCGAKVFNRLLHLHGIQYRVNGQWVLYSEHHGKGYTSSLTFRLQRSDGSEVEKLHTASRACKRAARRSRTSLSRTIISSPSTGWPGSMALIIV